MTTGKTIALTRRTFVGKVMSLLLNMLSRSVITFLPRSKRLNFMARPFRYDLNQTLYDYTVEVRNRFKGLDLIDTVPDELWMDVCDIVQETRIKTIPKKKKCKKSILKRRDITLPTKVHLVKAMIFPVAMYGCESWTKEEAKC